MQITIGQLLFFALGILAGYTLIRYVGLRCIPLLLLLPITAKADRLYFNFTSDHPAFDSIQAAGGGPYIIFGSDSCSSPYHFSTDGTSGYQDYPGGISGGTHQIWLYYYNGSTWTEFTIYSGRPSVNTGTGGTGTLTYHVYVSGGHWEASASWASGGGSTEYYKNYCYTNTTSLPRWLWLQINGTFTGGGTLVAPGDYTCYWMTNTANFTWTVYEGGGTGSDDNLKQIAGGNANTTTGTDPNTINTSSGQGHGEWDNNGDQGGSTNAPSGEDYRQGIAELMDALGQLDDDIVDQIMKHRQENRQGFLGTSNVLLSLNAANDRGFNNLSNTIPNGFNNLSNKIGYQTTTLSNLLGSGLTLSSNGIDKMTAMTNQGMYVTGLLSTVTQQLAQATNSLNLVNSNLANNTPPTPDKPMDTNAPFSHTNLTAGQFNLTNQSVLNGAATSNAIFGKMLTLSNTMAGDGHTLSGWNSDFLKGWDQYKTLGYGAYPGSAGNDNDNAWKYALTMPMGGTRYLDFNPAHSTLVNGILQWFWDLSIAVFGIVIIMRQWDITFLEIFRYQAATTTVPTTQIDASPMGVGFSTRIPFQLIAMAIFVGIVGMTIQLSIGFLGSNYAVMGFVQLIDAIAGDPAQIAMPGGGNPAYAKITLGLKWIFAHLPILPLTAMYIGHWLWKQGFWSLTMIGATIIKFFTTCIVIGFFLYASSAQGQTNQVEVTNQYWDRNADTEWTAFWEGFGASVAVGLVGASIRMAGKQFIKDKGFIE